MTEELAKEIEVYERNRDEWIRSHLNEWVWIHPDESFFFFKSYEEAVKKAYSEGFDNEPIFVRQITEIDEEDTIAGFYSNAI